jgi:hypothetical protein
MTDWTQAELQKIAASDDLHFAPLRDDDVTFGTPTAFRRKREGRRSPAPLRAGRWTMAF